MTDASPTFPMRPWRRGLLAAVVVVSVAVAGCGPASRGTGTTSLAKATDFTLKDLQGQSVSLSDHFGKRVVLLDFWATWCVPCEAEIPHLQRLHERYRDQGLAVIGISMDGPETVATVGPYAQRLGITFPVLLDQETQVTAIYNPHRAAPLTVLIDRQGRIRRVHEGYVAGDEVELEQEVKTLLKPEAAGSPTP